MPRCRAWRPASPTPAGHEKHPPGSCRQCWSPCRAKVARGQARCNECAYLQARHPDPALRRRLAGELGVPDEVLELLASDMDLAVAQAARSANDAGR